ncbi:GspH/FimT family pseudopilin [Reinekea forsetii]|nr:GspH/FimT family pseudopilin [Reinekea forsetii]
MKRQHGFTLVELLVTLIIIAIVAMFGAPSFRNVMVNSQIDSNLNSVRSSLIYARSEAVSKSRFITVCMSADGQTCVNAGAADWGSAGWIVWHDRDNDGVFEDNANADLCELDLDDCILRVFGPLEGDSTMVEANGLYRVVFSPQGQLNIPAAGGVAFSMQISNCGEGQERDITISQVGRTTTSQGDACDA